jgi:hypothetical protein
MNQISYFEEFASCWQRAVALCVSGSVCHHAPLGSITTNRAINQMNYSSLSAKEFTSVPHTATSTLGRGK